MTLNYTADEQKSRLTLLRVVGRDRFRSSVGEYLCKCGTVKMIVVSSVTSGHAKSCGCYHKSRVTKHGLRQTPEYRAWASMKSRCTDGKVPCFANYGGRGIRVCARWQTFENFLEDMGKRPSDSHSIDRIDVNANYEPGNCRWAVPKVQCRNKRSNHRLEFNGEILCLSEWAERTGIAKQTIKSRIHRGWDARRTLTAPVNFAYNHRNKLKRIGAALEDEEEES